MTAKINTLDALTLTLTRTQGEAFRLFAEDDAKMESVIASRPETDSYLRLRIQNKSQARTVCKNFRVMMTNLTDEERTGPSVKMSYALGRHVEEIKQHFAI